MITTYTYLDIWSHGRDAGHAGGLTVPMLKAAGYPYLAIIDDRVWARLLSDIPKLVEPTHDNVRRYIILGGIHNRHIFFQSKEDMELCRALLYMY